MIQRIRHIASCLRLGRLWLKLLQLRQLGAMRAIKMVYCKSRHLTRIAGANPIPCGDGGIEVHMLLHHKRLYQGLWAFYSLAHFASRSCRFVIHDDGSLTTSDKALLGKVLPGCHVIPREEADAQVFKDLDAHQLPRCVKLRRTLVFALKLFDPAFFARSQSYIIMDSDVLFFACPQQLLAAAASDQESATAHVYSQDVQDVYCLNRAEMLQVMGQDCIELFSPGVFSVGRGTLNPARIESYLARPKFWNEKGEGDYFAELTLWAMELTLQGTSPLSGSYAICPLDPSAPDLVFGHYCGGIRSNYIYYTRALPFLSSALLKAA